jgi:hypothetical protein
VGRRRLTRGRWSGGVRVRRTRGRSGARAIRQVDVAPDGGDDARRSRCAERVGCGARRAG